MAPGDGVQEQLGAQPCSSTCFSATGEVDGLAKGLVEKQETCRAARRTGGDPASENSSVKAIIMGLPRTR